MSEIKLGIIGGGQLGSMLCQAAKKLKIKLLFTQTMLSLQLKIFVMNL